MCIQKAFESLKCLAFTHNTFDIGTLEWICSAAAGSEDYDSILQRELISFISDAYQLIRKDKTGTTCPQTLTLLTTSSLLFNLYARLKKTDSLKLNNSFYNLSQSMDMSQYSMISVAAAEVDLKRFLNLVQRLACDKNLWKKVQIMIECRKPNAVVNRRYLHNLLQNIQTIMSKQKLPKQAFYETKKIFTQSPDLKVAEQPVGMVNEVVFSNQLNKVLELLQGDELEVGFAICRLYWTNYGERKRGRKCFSNCKYSGRQMIYNLLRHYITSFQRKSELFTESRNPLSNLLVNYISILFLPSLFKFSLILDKCMSRVQDRTDALTFYSRVSDIISQDLIDFIEHLPNELWYLLNTLVKIITKHKWKDSLDPTIPVKVLVFNRFLFNSRFTELFYRKYAMGDYEKVANLINEMFFIETVKKYEGNAKVKELIMMVNEAFSEALNYGDSEFEEEREDRYFIEQPIIKFDYQILGRAIALMQFTPKDQKHFQMTDLQQDLESQPQLQPAQLLQSSTNPNGNGNFNPGNSNAHPQPSLFTKKLDRVTSSPVQTAQSIPEEDLDYDLYRMSIDWEKRRLESSNKRELAERTAKPWVTFDKQRKKEVVDSYVQYKLHKLI